MLHNMKTSKLIQLTGRRTIWQDTLKENLQAMAVSELWATLCLYRSLQEKLSTSEATALWRYTSLIIIIIIITSLSKQVTV